MSQFPSSNMPRMVYANWFHLVLFRLFVSPFFIFLYFLGFWAIQWNILEILTLNARTNNYIFGAIFGISLPLICKSKTVCRIVGFGWLILFLGIFYHNIIGIILCRIPYSASTASHFDTKMTHTIVSQD